MRKIFSLFIFITLLLAMHAHAQQAVLTAGGNITGKGGSASFSIGQTAYLFFEDSTGSFSDGVQQAYFSDSCSNLRVWAKGPANLCLTGTVKLYTDSTPNSIYVWKYNGSIIVGADSSSIIATEAGTYSVELTRGECSLVSNEVIVTSDECESLFNDALSGGGNGGGGGGGGACSLAGNKHIFQVLDVDNDLDDDLIIHTDWPVGTGAAASLSGYELWISKKDSGYVKAPNNAGLVFGKDIIEMINADLDNNGWQDVVMIGADSISIFMNSKGVFKDKTADAGFATKMVKDKLNITAGNELKKKFVDVNQDGLLDMVVGAVNNSKFEIYSINATIDCNSGVVYDSVSTIFSANGNDGAFSFSDIDNDGDQDLLVTVTASQNQNAPYNVYLNDGTGQFEKNSTTGFDIGRTASFGSSADLNNDGKTDLFAGASDCCVAGNPLSVWYSQNEFPLYLTSTAMARKGIPSYNYGTPIDLDLDGWEDIMWTDINSQGDAQGEKLQYFRNVGENIFVEKAASYGVNKGANGQCCPNTVKTSAALLDYDGNGKLDVYIEANSTSPASAGQQARWLMLNTIDKSYLNIKLQACQGPKDGTGARIEYLVGGLWYNKIVNYNNSQNQPQSDLIRLGLNSQQYVDSMRIYWLGGDTTSYSKFEASKSMVIYENEECSKPTQLIDFDPLQDTILLHEDSVELDAGAGYESYVWNTGDSTQKIMATSSGTYIARVKVSGGCTLRDTGYVNLLKANILQADTTICGTDSLELKIDTSFISRYDTSLNNSVAYKIHYSWSTGDTTSSIKVKPDVTTAYTVTISDGVDSSSDMVDVKILSTEFNPLLDTISACGDSLVLDAGEGYTSYYWSTGDTTQTIDVITSGTYSVTVTNEFGCSINDTSLVSIVNANIIQSDTTICKNTPITISIDSSKIIKSIYQIGETGPAGGKIFYDKGFYSDSWRYLEAAINNMSSQSWRRTDVDQSGYLSTFANDNNEGSFNTQNIIKAQGYSVSSPYAAQYASDFTLNSYTDWFLPARNQLIPLISNLNGVGNVKCCTDFWSSTEFSQNDAWGYMWNNGSTDAHTNKIDFKLAVPVRYVTLPYKTTFSWSTGDTTASISVTPDTTTTYYVTVFNGITSCQDSVTVYVRGDNFNIFDDTTRLCDNQQKLLVADSGYVAFNWSTNETTRSIVATQEQIWYKLSATDSLGCSYDDSTYVIFENSNIDSINIPDTVSVCGTSTLLDAGNGYLTYKWSTGATTSSINVTETGFYNIQATSAAGCKVEKTILVSIVDANIINNDTTVCESTELTLSIDSSLADKIYLNASSAITDGLIAYYPFNGNANDASGNGNNGLIYGPALVADRNGLLNSAYKFTGSNSIKIPITQSNVLTYSIGAWFKTKIGGTVVGGRGRNGEAGLTLAVHSNDLSPTYIGQVLWKNDNNYGGVGKLSNQNYLDDKWHFALGTFSSSSQLITPDDFKLYIDGVLVNSSRVNSSNPTPTSPVNNNNTNLIIGNHQMWPNGGFNGILDDIRIYNRVITPQEVNQLYTGKTVRWSTGDTTNSIKVKPTVTTRYYVTVSDGITSCTDSVLVTVNDPVEFNPLPDSTFHSGDSYTLDATTTDFNNYRWNTGDITDTLKVTTNGLYKVEAYTTQGCKATDSTYVTLTPSMTMYMPNVEGNCNSNVELPVKASQFKKMLAMQGSINWLPNELEFDSIASFGPSALGLDINNFGLNQIAGGKLSFSWNSTSGLGVDLPDSSTLFVMRFTTLGSEAKTSPVSFSNSPISFEFIDENFLEKEVKLTNGSVKWDCTPDTTSLFMPAVNATCNNTVDLPVKANDFKNMISSQGSISWNAADLRFDNISNYGDAKLKLNADNFGLNQKATGKISFSWNSSDALPVDLADSATIFIMRFTVLATSNKTIPVSFSNTPTLLEFIDGYLTEKIIDTTTGSVIVSCGAIVSGKVKTPLNNAIRGVTVTMVGDNKTVKDTTDNNGDYSFNATGGQSYSITPEKNNEVNKLNGITTLDIALIQAHILGNTNLDAGYKVIAADVNSNNSVTTIDILFTRRLILGMDTSFPGNRTWAFVDADHSFTDISKPFPFPSSDTLVISRDTTKNFIAVKLGDVNYDRDPTKNSAYRSKSGPLEFYYDTIVVNGGAGSMVKVQIRSKKLQEVLGFQFTLNWDKSQLQFDSITNNALGIFYGERWKDQGMLTVSWNDPASQRRNLKEGELLFEMVYRSSNQLNKTKLTLSDEKIGREAFDGKYMLLGLQLDAAPIMKMNAIPEGSNSALRVYPNPAGRKFTVEYQSKSAGDGQLRLFDASGKVIHEQDVKVKSGLNSYEVMLNSQPASSTYILQMVQGMEVNTKKLIISNK